MQFGVKGTDGNVHDKGDDLTRMGKSSDLVMDE